MINSKAKTPNQMIEELSAEIIESTSLLEIIYKNSDEQPETDCAIACLLRSLYMTKEKADLFVKNLDSRAI